jgi:hypothetical protein
MIGTSELETIIHDNNVPAVIKETGQTPGAPFIESSLRLQSRNSRQSENQREMRSRLQPIVLGAAIVVVVVVAIILGRGGYLGELISRAGETGSPVAVHDLSSISTLQQTFNAQTGAPRLILLVSPT